MRHRGSGTTEPGAYPVAASLLAANGIWTPAHLSALPYPQPVPRLDLLDATTILWMGEFGRTPRINNNTGRDHFPTAWTSVLAGGGIAGGQAYGKTSDDAMEVVDGQVSAPDVLATLCQALGVAAASMQMTDSGRPVPITEGTPIREVLA